MRSILQDYRRLLFAPVTLVGWAGTTLLFAASGPFGSYVDFDFGQRLILWGLCLAKCFAIAVAVRCVIWATLRHHGTLVATLATVVLIVPGVTLPVHAVARQVAGSVGVHGPHLVEIAVFSFVIAAAMTGLRFVAEKPVPEPPEDHAATVVQGVEATAGPADDAAVQPVAGRLVQRLPEALHAPVVRLSVNDHYVEIETEAGTGRLLMRFSDALDELGAQPGMRIHRSHWVAETAVAGVERSGTRMDVRLRDGRRLPVSRANQKAVLAAFGHPQA